MTLDEAIAHERWAAENSIGEESEGHRQMAEWLRQARGTDEAARWYTSKIRELESENAKLRELVRDMHKAFFTLDIDHCQACSRDTINGPCRKYRGRTIGECEFDTEMRELGIEAQ